jgi:DNA-binding transcriptional LysR family regulator
MLDGIEALLALEHTGTVSEGATRLRLTQSAVSKRIKALETALGYPVVERDGRRLRLTSAGAAFLRRAKPLLADLRGLTRPSEPSPAQTLSLGLADSIASSWGPRLLKRSLAGRDDLRLDVHVHRSLLVLERVRLGQYDMGLIAGQPQGKGLVWTPIVVEPMVLVGRLERRDAAAPIFTIEMASATWRDIGRRVLKHPRLQSAQWTFVESFAAAAQMARAGFGRALVPAGIAIALGFRRTQGSMVPLDVKRQIQCVASKSINGLPSVVRWQRELTRLAPNYASNSSTQLL